MKALLTHVLTGPIAVLASHSVTDCRSATDTLCVVLCAVGGSPGTRADPKMCLNCAMHSGVPRTMSGCRSCVLRRDANLSDAKARVEARPIWDLEVFWSGPSSRRKKGLRLRTGDLHERSEC